MRGKGRRFRRRRLLIVLAALAGAGGVWMLVAPTLRRSHVERSIRRFEKNPSQASADTLVALLQSHSATTEQGRRILALLRRPNIRTRPAYPEGLPVHVEIEQPFHLDFRNVLWREEDIRINGQQWQKRTGSGGERPKTSYPCGLNAYDAKPGTHTVTIQGTCSIGLQRTGKCSKAGRFIRDLLYDIGLSLPTIWQPSRSYEGTFEESVEITVVPRGEVEPVALDSPDTLAKAMQKAFWIRTCGYHNPHSTASGQVKYDTIKGIFYNDLPMAVAFRLTLHLSGSHGSPMAIDYPTPLRARTGGCGTLDLHPGKMSIQKPDTYTGTITLTPDPNVAYEDPAIEAIWGREIELPISLTISKPSNRP